MRLQRLERIVAASRAHAGPLAIDLALRLTLLDLLLRPVGNWVLRPVFLAIAAIALIRPAWLRHPLPWFALAAMAGARVLLDWPLADNHAYLLGYWCLAAALALSTGIPDRVLAVNGRLLIGLVFLFACIWKFTGTGQYADGTFFQVTFLTDPRFEGFSRVAGGLDGDTYNELREFVKQHNDAATMQPRYPVEIPDRFRMLAIAATVWNLFINAALAIAFLWPGGKRLAPIRHILLLTYCTITYAIATVDGFGWLLLAMGAAQCTLAEKRTRFAYVLVFIAIIFYREIAWADEVFLPLLQGAAG